LHVKNCCSTTEKERKRWAKETADGVSRRLKGTHAPPEVNKENMGSY